MFYDKNNKYNDKSSHNTRGQSDSCYIDKFGNQFCEEDNTRLQNIRSYMIQIHYDLLNNVEVIKSNNLYNNSYY